MSTSEARCATHADERFSSRPERRFPRVQLEAFWRGEALPFDCAPARLQRAVGAS